MCFMLDRLPLRNRDYINNHAYFTQTDFNILSYIKNHRHKDKQQLTPSMESLQYACQNYKTTIRFYLSYITQGNSYSLEDESLNLLKILKKQEIKEDFVEPNSVIPESGITRLAILSRKEGD